MTALKLHNSLSGKKEVFEPIDPAHVRIYACGPTVYNYAHIGNARMAVVFDVLANLLRTLYPKVTYVSNITDVDDKIIAASQETGEPIDTITKKYADIYNEDMASLGVKAPDIQPRATDNIPQMIEIIEELIKKDHAYEADGHVLFDVPSFPAYGGLSGRNRDEQIAGARVEVASYKKDPADFILWKPSNNDEPSWDSPWGKGRPGWHIECSAMAQEHLGLPFDIHGGGADLKFPHHENEIAQSCCAYGDESDLASFSKYWVHNGFVTVNGEKMSKSIGNVTLAHDLIKDHEGEVLRIALLSSHYRQPLDWTKNKLHQAQKLYDRTKAIVGSLEDIEAADSQEIYEPILEALCDDLNTPLAFSELSKLIKKINKNLSSYADTGEGKKDIRSLKSNLHNSIKLLGMNSALKKAEQEKTTPQVSQEIEKMLQERTAAKTEKDFARADAIRDKLMEMGITIEDTPDGTIWKKI